MSNLAQSNKLIFLATFFAGAAALFYQIVWTRVVERFVGVALPTVALISVVLLGGLCLGAAIASFNSEKLKQPLKTFAFSQALLAGAGLFFILFQPQLYALIANISTTDPALLGLFEAFRLIYIALLLMLPTVLLGLVFPLLAKSISEKYSDDSASLYLLGSNAAGAVLGVLLCGLFILPAWGVGRSIAVAIVLNVLSALCALTVSNNRQEGDTYAIKPVEVTEKRIQTDAQKLADLGLGERKALFLVFCSGFLGFVFEMLWMRLLLLVTGSSSYALAIILACQIIGFSLGAYVVAFLAKTAPGKDENGLAVVERLWGLIPLLLLGAGLWTVASFGAINSLPAIYFHATNSLSYCFANNPALVFMTTRFLLASFLVTPLAFALGTIFPAVIQAYAFAEDRQESDFGYLYVANVLGAMAGCLVGGLVLHPLLSLFTNTPMLYSFLLVCILFFVLVFAVSNFLKSPVRLYVKITALVAVVLLVALKPAWDKDAMSAGAGLILESPQSSAFMTPAPDAKPKEEQTCLAYREGTNAVVSVIANPSTNTLSLKTDGKMEAALPNDLKWPSPTSDLPTHNLLAEIPLLLCPIDPEEALLIGFGSGATADSLLDYPGLKKLTAVDLAGDVFSFSKYFAGNFLHADEISQKQPEGRLTLVKSDGRNYLSLLKKHYDMIVCQPGEPYLNGMGDLYTREFWQLGRRRLRNYGLFCQWIQLYGLDRESVLTLCRTFQNVFPHTLVFRANGAAEIILVGFKLPSVSESEATELNRIVRAPNSIKSDLSVAVPDISINWNNFCQRFGLCDVKRRLARINVREPLDVMTMMRYGQSDLADLVEGKNATAREAFGLAVVDSPSGVLNTDDRPVVEFELPALSLASSKDPLPDLIHLFSAVPTRLDTFFFNVGTAKRETSDLYLELAMKYAQEGRFESHHKLREEFLTTCAMLARRAYRQDTTDGGLPGRGYVLQTFDSPIPKSLELLMFGFDPRRSKNEEDCLIIGRFFELRKLPERAGLCFARAVELAPKSARALRFFGNWLLDHGKYQNAIEVYGQAIDLDPLSDWALSGRGEALLHTNDRPAAVSDLRKALLANSEQYQARFLLGKTLCSSGQEKEGLEEIYWASLEKPENPEPNFFVTAYYVSTRQWQAAKDNLAILRRKLPGDPRVDYLAHQIEERKTIDK